MLHEQTKIYGDSDSIIDVFYSFWWTIFVAYLVDYKLDDIMNIHSVNVR